MKKHKLLSLSVMTIALTIVSCADKESPASLEGKWNISKMQVTTDGVADTEEAFPGNQTGCKNDYFVFAAATGIYGDYDTEDCTLTANPLTYTKTGNKIAVTGLDTDVINFEIVTLTASQLKLKEIQGGDYAVYTLTKQ